MKQIRMLAQYYVDLMMKLGLVRFSMLLAFALVVLAIVVQMAVTMVLHGRVPAAPLAAGRETGGDARARSQAECAA